MKYLHDNEIAHRNLKPSNILLDDNLYPKIADFSLSKYLDGYLIDLNLNLNTRIIGTLIYMAPEVASDDIYTFKNDVFSFSMILYDLYTISQSMVNGKTSYQMIRNMIRDARPNETKLLKGPINDLIIKCLSKDPEKTPTFDDIIHYFIEKRKEFWPEDVDDEEVEKYLSKFGLSFDQDKINDFFIIYTPKKKASSEEENNKDKEEDENNIDNDDGSLN